jgi:hypothetical protein
MADLDLTKYASYRHLPPLAGLSSMQRAAQSNWSLDESVERLKRLHYVLKRLYETLTARITSEPIYELKTAFSYHAYLCAEQVTLIRKRVSEMREPPLGLDKLPHAGLERFMDEVIAAPTTELLLLGVYEVALPAVLRTCRRLKNEAHPLADSPTIRIAKLMEFELAEATQFGESAIQQLVTSQIRDDASTWLGVLHQCLRAADDLDGTQAAGDHLGGHHLASKSSKTLPANQNATGSTIPEPMHSKEPYCYAKEPRRDERFQDSYNAGVNPEAFLYDERFSPRDKTLMMYYKRLREIDVPEMMASILVELGAEEPWEFHQEMIRQLWDEARHAMMGEVGFAAQGIDWSKIPINFTWSRNLNLQLTARERHGVLFFIEQGLMPRTGKRYEYEVGMQSGDPLSGLFQDFDWADEVLHAQIGRRWYVPRFSSLNEALSYGDACWSRVLSHWSAYREQGLTEHRNWWPELYRQACANWQVTPDSAALDFNQTYEDSRADLQKL